MSLLRRFSNEREGGGGGEALNHLPLLFCRSVYTYTTSIHTIHIYNKYSLSSTFCEAEKSEFVG